MVAHVDVLRLWQVADFAAGFFDGRLVFEEVLAVVLVLPLSHGSMAIKLLISLLDELLEWFVECQRSPGWILGPCQELDNGQGAGPHLEKLLAIWSCLKEVLWNGDKWLVRYFTIQCLSMVTMASVEKGQRG